MSGVKDLAEGKPFRVPLHAALVHFPLACFGIAVLLDLASWLVSKTELHLASAAFWAIAGGLGSALLAAPFGFVDYTSIRDDHPAKKTATWHMVLNLLAVLLFALSLGLRYRKSEGEHTPGAALLIGLGSFGLLMVSGYLGGHLVYNEGVGVGRHRRRSPLFQKTIIPRAAETGDWSSVCPSAEILDGQILRVEINSIVIALAKSDGSFFAVQEFCTHRFGPLSEGSIQDGKVVCPWHRSCFELKTGKVTAGPAKVDLKSYEVEERGGLVWIKIPVSQSSGPRSGTAHDA